MRALAVGCKSRFAIVSMATALSLERAWFLWGVEGKMFE
jgi:hypothetical protein